MVFIAYWLFVFIILWTYELYLFMFNVELFNEIFYYNLFWMFTSVWNWISFIYCVSNIFFQGFRYLILNILLIFETFFWACLPAPWKLEGTFHPSPKSAFHSRNMVQHRLCINCIFLHFIRLCTLRRSYLSKVIVSVVVFLWHLFPLYMLRLLENMWNL